MMREHTKKVALVTGALMLMIGCGDTRDPDITTTTPVTDIDTPAVVAADTDVPVGAAMSTETGRAGQFIDNTVLDRDGAVVGTVEELWEDQQGEPAYLAVKRTEGNDIIVVPAELAQTSRQRNAIKVPYTQATLEAAPKFDTQADLDEAAEQRVIAFYIEREPQVGQEQARQQQQRRQNQASISLKEEQVQVGKRTVQSGGVILRKVVRTDTVNKPVTVRREELVIERTPGSGKPIEGDAQFTENEVFVPLLREVPVVQKQVVEKAVVNVDKTTEAQQREVSAQVREEELNVQRQATESQKAAGSAASGQSGTSETPQ